MIRFLALVLGLLFVILYKFNRTLASLALVVIQRHPSMTGKVI
jgi:hypothetical protein